MTRPKFDYAADFTRWQRAPEWRKDSVAFDLVFNTILESRTAYFTNMPSIVGCMVAGNLDAMMPCGKRLGDCSPDDLLAMRQWLLAISAASERFADQLDPSLDNVRATLVSLIGHRASTNHSVTITG